MKTKIELVNDYKVRFLMPHGKDSSALLACPFCGGKPKISEMRYINTGRLYGYWLKCAGCGLEIKEQPGCWPAGKENESMLEAKSALENRWNTRRNRMLSARKPMNNQETLSAERGADSAAPCSAEPPRCTDCKWMTRDDRNGKPLCKRPGVGEKSVVNGAMLYPSCADQREDHDWLMNLFLGKSCGVAAKYFQPNTVLTALPDDQSKPPTT